MLIVLYSSTEVIIINLQLHENVQENVVIRPFQGYTCLNVVFAPAKVEQDTANSH